jgi:superfamily II DNA helicase RecQ
MLIKFIWYRLVCKTAFGMGVDVPNLVVIRLGCPPTTEELVQEFGRGGGDGRQAKGQRCDGC